MTTSTNSNTEICDLSNEIFKTIKKFPQIYLSDSSKCIGIQCGHNLNTTKKLLMFHNKIVTNKKNICMCFHIKC